jgi:cell wall-associated NlpC family hydrolase
MVGEPRREDGGQIVGIRCLAHQPAASSLRQPAAWAARYIGVPFQPRGRDWDGCDCWGLFRLVYREEFGIDLPSFIGDYEGTGKADFEDLARLITDATAGSCWVPIADGEERIGDGIALLIGALPVHVGIVVGGKRMLIVEDGLDACTESYAELKWRNRLGGFYRWRGAVE